ncbi:uncharacterized protein F5147DRAFT_728228 [Suillus discolor]|uniref:Uncharacterized protein n=1 Tax=Suillus discolor TaxID=1912936 RepID=A0A9P7ERS1_9AGAM|nr:uncharacterized protein F5147DRAFT_728228 [Suillus discolor]KAG2087121.1 hypothetical protein F5147DRAFT_728228 [Suillus discolor]
MSTSEEENASRSGSDTSAAQQAEVFERPKGWRRVDYHPITRVCLMGFVCCMRPGIFNALSGLGAGGQVSRAHRSVLIYPVSSVHDVLGSRLCLVLGILSPLRHLWQ